MLKNINYLLRQKRNAGFILVTCLLILFMLTILATSAFKTAFMQTLIANNFRFQTISFNNAENALLEAEAKIEENVSSISMFDFSMSNDGYYNTLDSINIRNIDWDDEDAVESGTASGDKFVVQYVGKQMIPGSDEAASDNAKSVTGSYVYAFVVTGRSIGAKHAERVVQSVYLTSEQP
ncbi:MAG: hypothetical protein GY787_03130 [Alteromonadales bacterium]|nr:hypothetical protein [Alteromonadales bacterium]